MPQSFHKKPPDDIPASEPPVGHADAVVLPFVSEAHLLSS